ncbi:MAG: PilZ domain-containing protein [Acidobacteriales bacterium]|nr:PilZ domain-containing protein [Terriglobales bacterium]
MIDHRKHRRYELRLPVELIRAGKSQISNRGETKNVSSGGVLFTSDAKIDVGESIEYMISLPQGVGQGASVRLRCLGKVLRLEEHEARYEDGTHRVGVAATMERYEFIRPKS